MFDTVFGLPVHPLIVHATVVIVPTAALSVALAAVWSRFRAWAGYGPLLLSGLAVILTPLSSASGEELEHSIASSELAERHAELGEGLLLPVLVLAAAAAALYWVHLRERAENTDSGRRRALAERTGGPGRPGLAVLIAIGVVATIGVLGTVVQVARIGHSGAEAAWSDVAQNPASNPADGDDDGDDD